MAFNNLLGNETSKEILLNSLKDSRVSNSYIFSGPSGVGKKLFAIEFAKLINCNSDLANRPADCSCVSCTKIEKLSHPDVTLLEYEGEHTIRIDRVRSDLDEKVYLSPFESRYKIFIVDNAERMNINAQNALLKTLEEPPVNSIIILVTQSINFIIPTIKSRCQIINFTHIEDSEIKTILNETLTIDEQNIETAVKLGRGSIGKALNLDKEQIDFRISVTRKLNSIRPDKPTEIFSLYEMLDLDSRDKNPEHLRNVFGIISDWLRDLILIKIELGSEDIVNDSLYSELSDYVSGKSLRSLLNKPEQLEESWHGITVLNTNRKLAFEDLMIKLSA